MKNKHLKSFLLGLTGVVGTYVLQWASNEDFGIYTPIVATMIPVIVNSIIKSINDQLNGPDNNKVG